MTTPDQNTPEWTLVNSEALLQDAAKDLASGVGAFAVDTERASGYTYFSRAYLIQVGRKGAGTYLVDPVMVPDLAPLAQVLDEREWILHAAATDLNCLEEVGLVPHEIFDTEVSARLLGYEKVGLGSMLEHLLGVKLQKSHSAANWSTRPLPHSWLEYAADDVHYLPQLKDCLAQELEAAGKTEYARQEFAALLEAPPKPELLEPWRKISGLGKVKRKLGLAVARELWLARDAYAKAHDIAPGRVIPDSSIVAVSNNIPRSITELQKNKEFRGKASRTEIRRWWRAILSAKERQDLPDLKSPRGDGIPHHRNWERKRPAAHIRLQRAKELLELESQERAIPLENLLKPALLREIAWAPPQPLTDEALSTQLTGLGARPWQSEITAPIIARAFVEDH